MDIFIKRIFKLLVLLSIVQHRKCSLQYSELDYMFDSLDVLIDKYKTTGTPTQVEADLWTWQEYQTGTGVGNREELLLRTIEIWNDEKIPKAIKNWQTITHENKFYMAGIDKSTLLLYEFPRESYQTTLQANITVPETIKTFTLISLPSKSDTIPNTDQIYVILLVEIDNTFYLQWFQLIDNAFMKIWNWQLGKAIRSLKYFNFNGRNKLVLLYKQERFFNEDFSPIEIYDIQLDAYPPKLQLCHQLFLPDVTDIEVCSTQPDKTLISLTRKNNVVLYEYKDEEFTMCTFRYVQNITIDGLINSACIESGYMNYLATSGSTGHLFNFHMNQFVLDEKMENLFHEIGNIHSVRSLPAETYRDEVMLLVQLKNSTVLALSWQGLNGFKSINYPSFDELERFDLSKVTIIPNYGFLSENTFVKFIVELNDLPRPNESEILKKLKIKAAFDDLIETHELLNDKISSSIEQNIVSNIVSMKYSNASEFKVDNLLVNGTDDFSLKLKSNDVSFKELQLSYEKSLGLMDELEAKLVEIKSNLNNTVLKDTTHINIAEVNIDGQFNVSGTLEVDNLTIDNLNDMPMSSLINDCAAKENKKITGTKSFPTINYSEGNFRVNKLNGIPLKKIEFQNDYKNYKNFDFSNISKLEIRGNLNFSKVSGVDWQEMMQNLVFKNEKMSIPGSTVITGELTSNYILMNYLNGLKYPSDYVVKSGPETAVVTGKKSFDSIFVTELANVKFINGINADEFIYLHENQNLSHQITFENLIVEENLQIDGKIIGLPEENIDPDLTLLNSNIVQANTKFSKLYVSGKVQVENVINGTKWSELDDLVLNDEENVVITGSKVFLNNAHMDGELEVTTGIINGHHASDFITLDTEQVLPNLSKMSGNIKFEKVSNEESLKLEKHINKTLDEKGEPGCMRNVIIFEKPPIVDDFSALYVNEFVTGEELLGKFNLLLNNAHFERLKVKKLIVEELEPVFVNNVNYLDFKNQKISKSGYQSLSGNVSIKHLELDKLYADFVNGWTAEDLETMTHKINSLYNDALDGKVVVESLNVTGNVVTRMINQQDLNDVLDVDSIGTFILRTNASVDNLVVDGLVNNLNFSKKAWDTVLRTEDHVIITGRKVISKLKTRNLQVDYVNKHSVDDIISPRKNQTLTGPVKIKGSVKVLDNFKSAAAINNVTFKDLNERFYKFGEDMYKLTGDFVVYDDTAIEDFNVFGNVRDKNIEMFLRNLIYLKGKKATVTGRKIFNNSVNFVGNITVAKNLNEISLARFYENAVMIDQPAFVKSRVFFEDDVVVENNVNLRNLKTSLINNVSYDMLMDLVVYLDRPTYITEELKLSDVTFKSDIKVESWNGIDMFSVLTLNTYQIIPNPLICTNVTVKNVDINGFVNGENLTDMYLNTFMMSNDQHITGKIMFMNNVYLKDNLSSRYINNVDLTKAVTLNEDDPLIGNFIFENPIVIKKNLNIRGKVNDVDLREWKLRTIKTNSNARQIIHGNWTIHGNVYFEQNVEGSGLINQIDVKKFADDMDKQSKEIDNYVLSKKESLHDKCETLSALKDKVDKMPYKFRSFEYLHVLEFHDKIVSVHYFDFNGIDYVMVNFESCLLDVLAYANAAFASASKISNFGIVKKYLNLNYDDKLYFVTLGKAECGRNAANVWVLDDHQFKHVLDIGNASDIHAFGDDEFAVAIDGRVQKWSVKSIVEKSFKSLDEFSTREKNVQFFVNENDTLLASRESIYETSASTTSETMELDEYENPFGTSYILSFRAGIQQKEFMLNYEDQLSTGHIFISNNDLSHRKILQTLSANKPNSFIVLNFDEFYETFLIFTENKRSIEIYDYRGIEGFKYHSTIKMKIDKLFTFKLRINPHFVKKHCLAAVQENKLIILEAKMYGERLDRNNELTCSVI